MVPAALFGFLLASDFTGAASCAECHAAHSARQRVSHHALALRRIADTELPRVLAAAELRERSGVEFNYRPGPQGVIATTTLGTDRAAMILEWAFGAGAQGITPVGRAGQRWVEHRISYFTEPGHPARTIGHPAQPSRDAASALGIVQDAATITRCFRCHAGGVKDGPDLSAIEPGVACERCHGPGRAHIEAARASRPLDAIRAATFNAARFPAKAIIQTCAECHRGPGEADPNDPVSIRFQPAGLLASRCFQKSGKLSCLGCHDPHEDARPRTSDHYSARCLSCHGTGGRTPVNCKRATRQNCVECHMPRSSPLPFISFTDHRIR